MLYLMIILEVAKGVIIMFKLMLRNLQIKIAKKVWKRAYPDREIVLKSPSFINNGFCWEASSYLLKEIKKLDTQVTEKELHLVSSDDIDAVSPYKDFLLHEERPHGWVYYKGKHYDIENLEGVDSWKELEMYVDLDVSSFEEWYPSKDNYHRQTFIGD